MQKNYIANAFPPSSQTSPTTIIEPTLAVNVHSTSSISHSSKSVTLTNIDSIQTIIPKSLQSHSQQKSIHSQAHKSVPTDSSPFTQSIPSLSLKRPLSTKSFPSPSRNLSYNATAFRLNKKHLYNSFDPFFHCEDDGDGENWNNFSDIEDEEEIGKL